MIPVGELWHTLGASDDLYIHYNNNNPTMAMPDFRHATLLLDGEPPSNCERTDTQIRCSNLPHSVQALDFRYDDTDRESLLVYIFLEDAECLATLELCAM